MSSFFEDVKDIRLCVHESISDFSTNRELKGWVSADEIIDSRELADEIARLSEENRTLKNEVDSLNQKLKYKSTPLVKENSLKEVYDALLAKKIIVPAAAANIDNDTEMDFASIFFGTGNHIINGITNSTTASEGEIFLYQHVCPILRIYGLVENEKVAGVRYRRYEITKKGLELIAYIEKEETRRSQSETSV